VDPGLVVENPNASARGAALLGGRATGITEKTDVVPPVVEEVQPDTHAHELLRAAFERWKEAATSSAGYSPP
jgi:sugar (pentulose or hexulose) kinase